MSEVGPAIDDSDSPTEQKLAEQKEQSQQTDRQNSVTEQRSAMSKENLPWSSRVELGLDLPKCDDKIEFNSFKKAWREWYKQSINIDAQQETRALNKARFETGRKHMEGMGFEVVPNPENGRVKMVKRDLNFYNFVGDRIPAENINDSVGVTTGWTEVDSDVWN